jgi:YfiH family protein
MSGIVDNWYRPEWPLGDRVGVVTTTRHGGFSKRPYDSFNLATHVGDDADAVMANRQRLLEQLALDDIQWLEQVHGIAVIAAGLSTPGTPAADGAWTDQRQLGIAVLTADCVPIVIAADDGSVAGIAHGGWRGLFDGVLRELVAALPAPPAALSAWIGPAISPAAYEVGEDVAERARAAGRQDALCSGRRPGKYQLDLPRVAESQLTELGVSQVFQSGVCSLASPETYSYRRDGVTGRMATLAWLR